MSKVGKGSKKSAGERLARVVQHVGMRMRHQKNELFYRLRSTERGYAWLQTAQSVLSPNETATRRRVAETFNATSGRPVMSPSGGWGAIDHRNFTGLDRVLATCRAIFEQKLADEAEPRRRRGDSKNLLEKRKFLRNLLLDDDIRRHPELLDFSLSDDALGIATTYLGSVPHLNRIDLLYSTPRDADDLIKSQLFHVDPEGLTQVKFFINVFDVGDAEGPFTFIPADDSRRILGAIRELRRSRRHPHVGRYSDEEVEAVGGSGAVISLKGASGSGVAIDTSRCLHLGSRVRPGAFRLVLYVQYCTSREAQGNRLDTARFRGDQVRWLAVQQSARRRGVTLAHPAES